MIWRTTRRMSLVFTILVTSIGWCLGETFPTSYHWTASDRAGFERLSNDIQERYISVPLDPRQTDGDKFDLYYFIAPATEGRAVKTMLFCAGGPGELITPMVVNHTLISSLRRSGYNIVYFHLRGSGFSQIPASNQFDKFLRTEYATADIDEIRKELVKFNVLEESRGWDIIVGYSYGTVLAQMYAHNYPTRVQRLVLIGAISMHNFKANNNGLDYYLGVENTRRQILEAIYDKKDLKQFVGAANSNYRTSIMSRLFDEPDGVFKKIDDLFGNEQFPIDNYCSEETRKALDGAKLGGFSRQFFQYLRDLRKYGTESFPNAVYKLDDMQVSIGKRLAAELIPELEGYLGVEIPKRDEDCAAAKFLPPQNSYRNLYAMRAYDGLLPRFLRESSAAGDGNIQAALTKSSGSAGVNSFFNNVGIERNQKIEPWDPADYSHPVPTLIIDGRADLVTAGGQARRYFQNGLIGPRALIEIEGIGHDYILPVVNFQTQEPILTGTIAFERATIPKKSTVWLTAKIGHSGNWTVSKPIDLDSHLELIKGSALVDDKSLSVQIRVAQNSPGSVHDQPRERDWTFGDNAFLGTAKLHDPPESDAGRTVRVAGPIVGYDIDKAHFQLQRPWGLDKRLQLTNRLRSRDGKSIEVEIQNNSDEPIDIGPNRWIYKIKDVDGTCQGESVNSLDCLIYAFSEMDFAEFVYGKKVEIFDEITRQFPLHFEPSVSPGYTR